MQHAVLTTNRRKFLINNCSLKMVRALKTAGVKGLSYEQLSKRTKLEIPQLYMFAHRLHNNGIVYKEREGQHVILVLSDQKALIEPARVISGR